MEHGRGVVSVDVVRAGPLPAVRVIEKYLALPAFAYLGKLFVPLKNAFCIITVQARESGVTGLREAVMGRPREAVSPEGLGRWASFSNQFCTSTSSVTGLGGRSFGCTIRKRWPSGATS